jgi:hypothetical protein
VLADSWSRTAEAALPPQRVTQVHLGFREVRTNGDSFADELDGFLSLNSIKQHHAQKVERVGLLSTPRSKSL